MSIKTKLTSKISLNDLPDLLTIKEVAEILRVSPLTIKRWGKKGKLPAIRINSRGDRRYKKEVVMRLIGSNEE
jgi:excisionase family DNA binding protein